MRRIRVVLAVAKKDLIQLMRYPTWLIQVLIWPLIFPFLYIMSAYGFAGPNKAGLSLFQSATGTDSIMGFIMIGTMVWSWVNWTLWSLGGYLRNEQLRGTLEANWLCPINKFDYLIGGGIVTLFRTVVVLVVSVIEYRIVYGVQFTGNIFTWVVVFFVLMPGVYGLGMFFSSLVLWAKETGAAVNVARGAMMILCGITFPITVMPGWMQAMSKFLPFTYGILAARQVMVNGETLSMASANMLICFGEGAVLILLGRLLFMHIEQRVRISGSLERF